MQNQLSNGVKRSNAHQLVERFLWHRFGVQTAALFAVLGVATDLPAQTIPESRNVLRSNTNQSVVKQAAHRETVRHHRLPSPVRQADHTEPLSDAMALDPGNPDRGSSVQESGWGFSKRNLPVGMDYAPKHAHRILRAPSNPLPTERGNEGRSSFRSDLSKRWIHPPYSSHRRRIQPAPPMLPGGKERAIWKNPYSYGYFGASGTRHWSLHHGYRDRYTEWRLK